MRIATRTTLAALGTALTLSGGAAEAAQGRLFCDGPIRWCDPIVDGSAPRVGDAEVVLPAVDQPTGFAVHRKVSQSVPASLITAVSVLGDPFIGLATGAPLPLNEQVGYAYSKSLGIVSRDAVNGGMAHALRIDDPAFNGRAQAIVIAGRVATPGHSKSALGVWYDGASWWIYNQDLTPMGAGETFVYAEGTSVGGQVVHDAGNDYQGTGVYVDDPRLNGNPQA
ncbi:MAG TPA: hypothetical protein VFO85_07095, partial [Vicinamibacteria bacterium]|nr:hypothetical protein [Vicinamibacteria bacterium]